MPFPEAADDWPPQLQSVVRQHGPKRVHDAGVAALGYPPAWAHTHNEFLSVIRKLGAN